MANENIRIDIDASFSKAIVTVENSKPTLADVKAELALAGVRFGIDESALVYLFAKGLFGKPVCAAKAQEAIDGENGTIEYLYEKDNEFAPKEDENGIVNYRDLGHIKNVSAGTVIAKITPPTKGTQGIDIRGMKTEPYPGTPAQFTLGTGTKLADGDTRIIASIDGNLRWKGSCFVVDNVVTIAHDIDASIGNIDFLGDIVIKGDVNEGYVIKSGKNISISGTATGAFINAGGRVDISCGCLSSHVTCGASAKLAFCENSEITCNGNLAVSSLVGCTVFCKGEMNVTSGKGAIVGGKTTCLQNLTVGTLGAETYTKTYVTLGNNAVLTEEKIKLQDTIQERYNQIKKLTQVYDLLSAQKKTAKLPPEREEMLTSAIKGRFAARGEIKTMERRINDIDSELRESQSLLITIKADLFPGTNIRINSAQYSADIKSTHCKASVASDGLIEIKPL